MRLPPILIALAWLVASCSSGSGTSSNGTDWAAACKADADYTARCGPEGGSSVRGLCAEYGESCVSKIFRAEAARQVVECQANADCAGSAEGCWEDLTLPPSPAASEWQTACQQKQTACEPEITSDNQFFCFDLSASTDAYISTQVDCLQKPCNEIRACQDSGKAFNYCQ